MNKLPVKVMNEMVLQLGEDNSCCNITLHRTLRLPMDGKVYNLPPSLGLFPIKKVDDYRGKVPKSFEEKGGIFFPMYQREAMWMKFDLNDPNKKPKAIKIAVGKVNCVTGDPWKNELGSPQDYIVVPDQKWLDGINSGKSHIQQFVAMPKGSGHSVEKQVTGVEKHGGVQVLLYDSYGKPSTPAFPEQKPIVQPLPQPVYKPPQRIVPSKPIIYDPLIGGGSGGGRKPPPNKPIIYDPLIPVNPNLPIFPVNPQPQPIIEPQPIFDPHPIIRPPVRRAVKGKRKPAPRYVDRIVPMVASNTVCERATLSMKPASGISAFPVQQMERMDYFVDDTPDDEEEDYSEDLSEKKEDERLIDNSVVQNSNASEMSISAGGKMNQSIAKDKHGIRIYNQSQFARVFINIVNSALYEQITGEKAPETPISKSTYTSYGYPFLSHYSEEGVGKSNKLANVKNIKQIDNQKNNVRDGEW